MSRNICLVQKTEDCSISHCSLCCWYQGCFQCFLGTDQSLPLCSRFLSRRHEFNSAFANSRSKKKKKKKKLDFYHSSKHSLRNLCCPLLKISILDTLLMWRLMGIWYMEINYRSHWPLWPRPNPLLSNLPEAHNELSHSLSPRNWSRRVKRSSKGVSDATWGVVVECSAGQPG